MLPRLARHGAPALQNVTSTLRNVANFTPCSRSFATNHLMDALVDMPKKEPWEGASNIPPTPPPADFDWGAHPEALKELYERELEIYKERASEDAAEMAEKDAFLAKTASFSLHYPHPTGEQVTVEKDSVSVGGKKIKRTQVERFVPDEVEYDWGGDERGAFACATPVALSNACIGALSPPSSSNYILQYSPTGISSSFTTNTISQYVKGSGDGAIFTIVSDPGGGEYGLRFLKEFGNSSRRSIPVPELLMLTKTNFYDMVSEAGNCGGAIIPLEEGGDLLSGWSKLGSSKGFKNLVDKVGLLTHNERLAVGAVSCIVSKAGSSNIVVCPVPNRNGVSGGVTFDQVKGLLPKEWKVVNEASGEDYRKAIEDIEATSKGHGKPCCFIETHDNGELARKNASSGWGGRSVVEGKY